MQNVIEVGDEITNHEGVVLTVEKVQQGKHGLFIEGSFSTGRKGGAYFIPELPVDNEIQYPWYEFAGKAWGILANGIKISAVGFSRGDSRSYMVEAYDIELDKIFESMRKDENDNPTGRIRTGTNPRPSKSICPSLPNVLKL